MDLKKLKVFLLSNRITFFCVMILIYIALVVSRLPYGLLPSIAISFLFLLNAFLIAFPTGRFLLPKLTFYRRKKNQYPYNLIYVLLSIGLIAIVSLTMKWLLSFLYNFFELTADGPFHDIQFVTLSLLFYALCNIGYFKEEAKQANQKEDRFLLERKNLELKVLRSQINTHFLFNALNNIYSMTYFNTEKSSEYVMKLSQMLRYVLEDCDAEFVSLSKEMTYIKNFIDFQRAQYDEPKNIEIKCNFNNQQEIKIPPMIFQPLIENCFKHSCLNTENGFVNITMEVGKNKIIFSTKNSKTLTNFCAHRNTGKIGIENLKRRLEISYPQSYKLNTFDKGETYQTELVINLNT